MGKKAKKKARSGHIDKRVATSSSKETVASVNGVLQQSSANDEISNNGVIVVKEKRICPHINKGVNLEKVSEKLNSSEPIRCEDCREGVVDRKAGKGKGKHGNKKCGGESKAVWICLFCGHFSCGGAGFPTTPQSHAVRHARHYHHQLAVQFQNPQLRWCFSCSTIIPIEKAQDPLCDVVKLIKGRSQTPAVDVEDTWFGTGSVTSGVNSETSPSIVGDVFSGYTARGLMNLGNTCFFNSVMQNLLAMDKLRDYFGKFEGSLGPLTTSLKKLFIETNPEVGLRNVINPRSFLGCVCAKAPQFRGYQQHDSHELLRCLLDAWCTEESNSIKQKKSSMENGKSSQIDSTFVDAIFGGQLSSTVRCLECCHTSTVYEPFLDISLPVPTKKQPSRKAQKLSRAKKPNLPPKRSARIRSKVSNNSNVLSDQSSPQIESEEHAALSITNEKGHDLQNSLMDESLGSKPSQEEANKFPMPSNDTTRLDFRSPDAVLKEENAALVIDKEDAALKSSLDSSKDVMPSDMHDSISCNDLTWLDFCEPAQSLDSDGMGPHINPVPATQDSETEIVAQNFGLNSASGDSGTNIEDEAPLLVQDSAIILLPYKDDAPSEIFRGEGDNEVSEFDGFGGLFEEPEAEVATVKSSEEKTVQTGIIVGQSSESDHEVDNSDATVSIERCLSYFIKPELLLKDEHAWQCENCSKVFKLNEAVLCNGTLVEESPHDNDAQVNSKTNGMTEDGKHEKEDSDNNPSVSSCSNELPLPQSHPRDTIEPQNVEGDNDSTSVAAFSQSKQCEDEEMNSETVKVKRDATKTILINRAPPILTVHLKRFCQDARGRLSKLKGYIDFRDTLDITPYIDPRCNEKDEYKYRLLGVVEHSGSMRGGHYVAYVRGGKKSSHRTEIECEDFKWYYASDAHVREVNLEEVLRCEAYILFYEKI